VSAGPSLYRRHRPRTFDDVVGQEHVVRTLRNAIDQNKVHHAYLFVGSRGTGKTSMAKMLAACLNCVNGPTTEPCGVCESCVTIASATSMDVIEMDAASNNSVDDIRELRESVQYAPVSGRSKVYILDEAHMLTPAAWNAFLKTLEEPPPSTIFVLATTEAHKIMDTVVDRCHRFDFRRPTVEQLASVLRRVAAEESITIAPDAVALVARGATGSYRDALGTLEQLVTYSGHDVSTEDVMAVLGATDDEMLFGALEAVAAGDAKAAWQLTASLAESGREASQFLRDLEAHVRDLMVVQTLGEVPSQLCMTPERDARLAEQAAAVGPREVVRLLDLLGPAQRMVRDGADAQTQLELLLVRAAAPEVDPSSNALLARLERLEAGSPRPAPPAPARAAAPPPAPVAPPEPVAPPAPRANGNGAPATPVDREQESEPAAEPEPAPEPVPRAAAVPVPVAPEPVPVAPEPAPAGPLDLTTVQEHWPAILASVKEQHGILGAALDEAWPVEAADRGVTLAFDPSKAFYRRKAEDAACRKIVQETFRAVLGTTPRLDYVTREATALVEDSMSEGDLVARFKQEFDAEEIVPDQTEEQS
jgi:DNA polymerase-3 subunit gamma/tau